MTTAIIEIKNDLAYSFLHNLERMDVLRIVSKGNNHKQKLSDRFAGSLSNERVEELQKELDQMRNEWNRDIY
jgi:HAMP domain-containing protein